MADTGISDQVDAAIYRSAKVASATRQEAWLARFREALRERGYEIVPIGLDPEEVLEIQRYQANAMAAALAPSDQEWGSQVAAVITAVDKGTMTAAQAMEAVGYPPAQDPEDADDGFADVAKALPRIDRERLAWAASKHDLVLWSSPLRCLCGWRDSQALAVGSWAIETAAIETARARWREHLIAGIADAYENRVTFYATPGPSYEQPQPPLGQVADAVAEVERQREAAITELSRRFTVQPVPAECPCGVPRSDVADETDATWLRSIERCMTERRGESLVPRG